MSEHNCSCHSHPLVPQLCRIISFRQETPDVKTYRIQTLDGKIPFVPLPGQLQMLSLPGVGEAMFSITSHGEDYIESSIKCVGQLTEALDELSVGDIVGSRGPYGNCFPAEAFKGHDILFIAGGIGLAPVRSLILECLKNRGDYGHIDILYGSRSAADLVFKDEIFTQWPALEDINVHLTVDRGDADWDGNVGFVPAYLEELAFDPAGRKVALCGPPVMIKFCTEALERMGFEKENVYTTLEKRMKCGVGKCGRCNIGSKYVCLDGPVFTMAELDGLPLET